MFACDASAGRSWFVPAFAICHVHSMKIPRCPLQQLIFIPHALLGVSFFFIRLDIFHITASVFWIQAVMGSSRRWAAESQSGGVVGDAPSPALRPFSRVRKCTCSYPLIIHTCFFHRQGRCCYQPVEKNPFTSKRALKWFAALQPVMLKIWGGGGQGSPGSHGSHFTGTDYAPKIGNTLGKLVVAIFFFLIINHLISILRNWSELLEKPAALDVLWRWTSLRKKENPLYCTAIIQWYLSSRSLILSNKY